ncbi:hypothetical protein LJB99_02895 [Deltaproteobacteria bacterium OttesenSCG-928-K17]|nr:hypothetical protein [Deltaproteobacteria bacterium OttesenSCG-928-K17]
MQKLILFLLTVSATILLAPGCGSGNISEKDYVQAINSQISQNDGYVKISFPYKTVEKPNHLYFNNMCEALVKQGLLTVTATENGKWRPINTYELTSEGKKYFTPNKGLKFADVSVDRIVKIEDSGIQNIKEIRFTYKLENIAPWAGLAKSESPSQLLKVMDGNQKKECLARISVENGKLVVDKAMVFNPPTDDNDGMRSQYEGYL